MQEQSDGQSPRPNGETAPSSSGSPTTVPSLPRIAGRIVQDFRGIRVRLLIAQFLVGLLPRMTFGWLRPALYRLAGMRFGLRTRIYGKVEIEGVGAIVQHVTVGRECMFTTPLYLNASGEIRIGNNVVIGHHVVIITDSHEMDSPRQRCGERYARPVVIEDGVWIGARATILPGVTLGTGCVVAAGAMVTKDVPRDTLVGGVPARPIKVLNPGEPAPTRSGEPAPTRAT